jgi:hypothetical protein
MPLQRPVRVLNARLVTIMIRMLFHMRSCVVCVKTAAFNHHVIGETVVCVPSAAFNHHAIGETTVCVKRAALNHNAVVETVCVG